MPNKNAKKYIITSLTLCGVGLVAAVLIAGANLITKDRIAKNEVESQEKALRNVFGEDSYFSEEKTDFKEAGNYLKKYYIAYADEDKTVEIGYAYYSDGKNAYGEIAMMTGVTPVGVLNIYLVTNTESYASTLVDNYVTPVQNGDREYTDVTCGATYGAKLIKSMIDEAKADYASQKGSN